MRTQRKAGRFATRAAGILAFMLPFLSAACTACAVEKKHAEPKSDESAKGHSHATSEIHGGSATMTTRHHFETLFTAKDVRLWIYDGKQLAIADPKGVSASLSLHQKQGEPVRRDMTYVAPDVANGRAHGYFTAPYDFAAVAAGDMKALIRIEGLGKTPEEFRTPVAVTDAAVYACPMHPDVQGADPVPCSKCGMALERTASSKTKLEGGDTHGSHAGHSH